MNAQQAQYIQMYCGMNPGRADAFLKGEKGEHIHPATMTSLVAHGLVTEGRNGLTDDGIRLMERIREILENHFAPEKPWLEVEQAIKIEPTAKFAHLWSRRNATEEKLGSSDVKMLKLVGMFPGISGEQLAGPFGMNDVCRMVERGWLKRNPDARCEKYCRHYLTGKAKQMLRWCLGTERMRIVHD